MSVEKIKQTLNDNQSDISFLIGNGINRHYNQDNISWNDLLLELWNKHAGKPLSIIPDGLSYTEFYDVLDLADKEEKKSFQKDVKDLMIDWSPNLDQNHVLEKIQSFNAPILTTNYDDLMAKSLGLELHRTRKSGFTDHYPWDSYYAHIEQDDPTNKFSVWHVNGMVRYHRSIKMGLSQYMGNVDRSREMIGQRYKKVHLSESFAGTKTWLDILFNRSVFIFGLGLDESEVFLRWLLIERARYYRRYPEEQKPGWYLAREGEDLKGKEFFLSALGIQVLNLSEYEDIYKHIWT